MSSFETTITTDRECDHCGYNLKGLPTGSKCPECGTSMRRKSIRTSGTMSDEAPTRFVKVLRYGFLLSSFGIVLSVLSVFLGLAGDFINFVAMLLWIAGIYFITQPRPGKGTIRPDKVLDNNRMRQAVRMLNLAWPAAALVSAILAALRSSTSGGPPYIVDTLTVLRDLIGIIAWLGMIPTSIYLAELAYWSSNNHLAQRMRGAAWILAVVGTITIVIRGSGLVFNSPVLLFVAIFPSILIFLTIVVYNFTFIQMTGVMHEVIKHQRLAAGSFARVEERRKREEKYRGRIVDDTYCDECGYNLIGLEQGGRCPECGTSFGSGNAGNIRDPARTPSYHDNSDLAVEQGENKGVYFNDQLDASGKPKAGGVPYTPATQVPDEGDIPLAMGNGNDDENDENNDLTERRDHDIAQDTPKKRDSPDIDDIDGIEPISFA